MHKENNPVTEQDNMTPAECRVLLVEDDEDDRIFGKAQLDACPQVSEVKCFGDGDELIRYMNEQGFDDHTVLCMTPTIIIVDLNMPRIDGFKILQRLKSDPFLSDIPVAVLSGQLNYETMHRAMELGADAILRKPLRTDKLTECLKHAWQWPTREMWMA